MTAKHTPGPWYALRGQRNISIRHKTGDRLLPMVNVASVRGQFPTDCPYGSSEANARLIAAAPELLEALIAITTVRCDGMDPTPINEAYEKADASIARSTRHCGLRAWRDNWREIDMDCPSGKVVHTLRTATESAKRARRRTETPLAPYRCTICGGWHVGQKSGMKRPAKTIYDNHRGLT